MICDPLPSFIKWYSLLREFDSHKSEKKKKKMCLHFRLFKNVIWHFLLYDHTPKILAKCFPNQCMQSKSQNIVNQAKVKAEQAKVLTQLSVQAAYYIKNILNVLNKLGHKNR